MKAFETNNEKIYWVKTVDGKLSYWNGKENQTFDQMRGMITDVYFKDEEYNGRKWTDAMFRITCENEKYILSVNTNSGYFRTICNFLHNIDFSKEITIRPNVQEKDGKKNFTIFLMQNDAWVKSFYNKENPLPVKMNVVEINGQKIYDNSEIITFYKNWLTSTFAKLYNDKNDDIPF